MFSNYLDMWLKPIEKKWINADIYKNKQNLIYAFLAYRIFFRFA